MTDTEALKKFLTSSHYIPDDILDEYVSQWSEYSLPKKTVMTAPGQKEEYLYYILEGVQKSYYLHNDKFYVIAFTYAPGFSGIIDSVLTGSPSKYYLETISESRFLRIPVSTHEKLVEKHRSLETMYRKYNERVLVGLLDRYFELMAYDIESRFKSFVKRSPHLLAMVSQKDLASYLRIDATNFSKLINSVRI
ncbi:MAG: Crp/Fnr family transcriptional regulator [Balneolaceae bacterium]|nr:Crp/Fnr family transcriptional regulator [Balneolaceae bacterium]MBO6546705.1 Crp/Fnr family transcriptional regulator [Balneolaceae bacterium]MBO6649063.1 Crp/Fnr family transcriptional regulator [Balneolaceae bacterium]